MRVLKAALGALALSVGLAAPVGAGDYEDGVDAANRGDYATAVALLRPLAEQGHAGAQTSLGLLYIDGQGVPQDVAEALRWVHKAAEQGFADAQVVLGAVYTEAGLGVPQDHAEAVRWFRKAAEQGYAKGQVGLGIVYFQGRGVPKNYVLAYMWLDLAAAQKEYLAGAFLSGAAEKMTEAQLAEAQKLAREWRPASER